MNRIKVIKRAGLQSPPEASETDRKRLINNLSNFVQEKLSKIGLLNGALHSRKIRAALSPRHSARLRP